MADEAILRLLQYNNQLKRTPRTGWLQRGVPDVENVAAHTQGVAFIALVLAELVAEPVETGRLLRLALIHDLPECITTDIPSPVWGYLPEASKPAAERRALGEILAGVPFADGLTAAWDELQAAASLEARLVKDADRLELYLQAVNYEAETGNRQLAEFWSQEPAFYTAPAAALYRQLRDRRAA